MAKIGRKLSELELLEGGGGSGMMGGGGGGRSPFTKELKKTPYKQDIRDDISPKEREAIGMSQSGGRGVTTKPGDKNLGSPSRFATKILPSRDKPLTEQMPEKEGAGFKRGGAVKKYASGGSVSSRADGIAQRGKTRGKMR